ncbi:uncharacterized protein EV420DRAFT_1584590 [Desarmillaria tabescens]|uniref:Uncharacterized protein n=1 Tax=Armillaria tabescens TaxID=1929756 RepID=A0AA39MLI2_ARMTA|nr:uncharacterized protein EV420DRAFT_1584590 [Desarmillaria tabescens]KAK0439261.1 hypothetical protein EV420DRAFT_1584590 [Desarmillaria tabescens]
MSARLFEIKGWAHITIAILLTVKPSVVYNSPMTPTKLSKTDYKHISDAAVAPGFNQAIACMVAAVGVGFIVGARSGPAARPALFSMTLTWGVLSLITCATSRGSATLLFSGINHILFSGLSYYFDSSLVK